MTSKRIDPFPVHPPYQGIYAYGVEVPAGARTLHISGQVGVDPKGQLAEGATGQIHQALDNVEAVLAEASMTINDIVKMSFFLTRPEDMADLLKVREARLDGVRPAVTTLFVAGLVHPDWRVEIEVVAAAQSA